MASGLQINLHKSKLYGIGVNREVIEHVAMCTGCRADSFPFRYLGLLIGQGMNRRTAWEVLCDRSCKKTLNLEIENAYHWRSSYTT